MVHKKDKNVRERKEGGGGGGGGGGGPYNAAE